MKIYLRLLTFLGLLLFFEGSDAQNPTSSFTYNGSCEQDSILFESKSTTPVGQIIRYFWNFGTINLSDTSSLAAPKFVYPDPGDYLVRLIVWNSLNFTDTSSQIISIKPRPTAAMNIDVPCVPDAIVLNDGSTVSSGSILEHSWKFDTLATNANASWTYVPISPDSYTVSLRVKSNFGCVDSVTQTINYTETPIVNLNLSSPVVICDGDSVTVVASGASTYLWNDSSTNKTKALFAAGQYIITGYTGNKCFSSDTIDVDIAPSPTADAGIDTTIDKGFTAQLRGLGGSTYLWSPAGTLDDAEIANPIAQPLKDTRYTLKVTNSFGCSAYDSVNVFVNQIIKIAVHNLITPNNDGQNDVWDLSNIPGLASTNVHVFNRWGWEVFQTEDYQNDWQGTFNQEPLPDGTYIYVIEFKNGILDPLRGTLEIVRNTQK